MQRRRLESTPLVATIALGVALGVAPGFAMLGCEQDGPLEQAGESADEIVDDAADAIEDAGDEVKDVLKGDG